MPTPVRTLALSAALLSVSASTADAADLVRLNGSPMDVITNPRALAAYAGANPAGRDVLERRARTGHPLWQEAQAFLYIQGIGVAPDFARAQKLLAPLAAKKRPMAYEGLIQLHTQPGPQQDFAKAARYAQAYASVHPNGAAILGYFTTFGRGVTRNEKAGLGLIAEAVNKGSRRADYITASFYLTGGPRPKDANLASIYLQSAVQKAEPQALMYLGNAQVTGNAGYRQNIKAGYANLNQAARLGEGRAYELIAYHQAYPPLGYKPNWKEALRVARICGDGMNANCNHLAGYLRIQLTRNYRDPEALKRLKNAAAFGHERATKLYLSSAARLTDATDAAILLEGRRRKLVAPADAQRLEATLSSAARTAGPARQPLIRLYADAAAKQATP